MSSQVHLRGSIGPSVLRFPRLDASRSSAVYPVCAGNTVYGKTRLNSRQQGYLQSTSNPDESESAWICAVDP